MSTATLERTYEPEDLLRREAGHRFELVDGEGILPGFRCKLADLFQP